MEAGPPTAVSEPADHADPPMSHHGGRKKEEPMFQRRKGESLKAYFERIDVESNARIMESFRKNRKMSDRRKE